MASDTDLHQKFLTRFDTIVGPLQEERALCLEDRRFAFIPGAQWEQGAWYDMSENMIRVEVNKTAIGLKRIQDDYRANRVTVNYRAVRDTAEGTADLLDGLFRADVYRCKGAQAFDNAFLDGAAGGMGAWLLANEYEDEYDPDNEHQRIRFDTISDADQRVFFDDNSRLYDKSDAKDCYVLFFMAKDAFEEAYPDAACDGFPEGLIKPSYDWYRPDGVVVAWYYRVEEVTEIRRTFVNIPTGEIEAYWESDLSEDAAQEMLITGWQEQPAKKRKRRRVAKYVMSGGEMLEKKRYIAGSCIPVIPFYGQRSFIDDKERVQGHVRQAKDSQRIYNTILSKMTETSAQSPVPKPIFDPTQMAGIEQHWADMNIMRHPYALAHSLRDEDGKIVQTGPVGMITPPQMAPVDAAIIQVAGADIEQLTGGGQNADEVRSNVSAEAMDIAATRLDERDGSFKDNFCQSMQRCGEVYHDMAKDVYFELGREVEWMNDRFDEITTRKLMETGVTATGTFVTKNDLSKGRFMVIADVTEATKTRQDKTVRALINIAELAAQSGDQQSARAAIITAVENMDGEGMDDYKKWNRRQGLGMGLFTPNDEEKAQMAAEAEQQQPDPASLAILAQAKDFEASAQNKQAQARLNLAKVGEVESAIVKNFADAGLKATQAHTSVADTAIKGRQTAAQIEQARAAKDEDRAA